MSEKYASISSYVGLILVAVLYINTATGFDMTDSNTIGPGYFPKLLGGVLIIFCGMGIIISWRQKESEKIIIPNLKMIIVSIAATVLLLVVWRVIGNFYILSFFFLLGLTSVFRKSLGFNKQNVVTIIGASLGVSIVIYLLFGVMMGVKI